MCVRCEFPYPHVTPSFIRKIQVGGASPVVPSAELAGLLCSWLTAISVGTRSWSIRFDTVCSRRMFTSYPCRVRSCSMLIGRCPGAETFRMCGPGPRLLNQNRPSISDEVRRVALLETPSAEVDIHSRMIWLAGRGSPRASVTVPSIWCPPQSSVRSTCCDSPLPM